MHHSLLTLLTVKGQWGGLPYEDLIAGYRYVLKHFKEIDPDRTFAAGASYGGAIVVYICFAVP
jgi:dipeptidyl aminopeptidase/acylaminoacyl peptidase